MNIVKFQDIVMNPDVLVGAGYAEIVDGGYIWKNDHPFGEFSIDGFCEYFNSTLRNKYAYVICWTHILPMVDNSGPIPAGDPFNPGDELNYVNVEMGNVFIENLLAFKDLRPWVDQVRTLGILQNDKIKYDYLNEFTPDDDITIDELKMFRTWLASILLANTPVVNNWNDPERLTTMLTYYKQDLKDATVNTLAGFAGYMQESVLVANTKDNKPNLASLALSAGCGCNGGVRSVGNISAVSGCDPLQMYRNAIYNYMVETFSNMDYWMGQVEICVEMKKYLEGILKVGLPLGSKIIDPLADCECNTMDADSQVRYRRMIEALIQSLTYIIEGSVSGNRNYISTAFSNWATYLYEYMYWV